MEPVDYLEMLALVDGAAVLLTDSGGLQKETFFLGTPCVVLREETEYPETVALGWSVLPGVDPARMVAAVRRHVESPPATAREQPYGDGHAGDKIAEILAL